MKKRNGLIARPGYRFLAAGLSILVLGFWVGQYIVWLGLVCTAFFAYFFRDPERAIPSAPGLLISPADGRIIAWERMREDQFLRQPVHKLSIFMNVFDVHVNRAPLAGRIKAAVYQPGRYLPANNPQAPDQNEQLALHLESAEGIGLVMVQIAGVLARRIISYVQAGDQVDRGERVGLICFGSRVDLYIPEQCQLQVQLGQKVKAGTTIIGRWP
ncbi:phosphatidylserine decarboxylase family protein [Desulfobacca acetoxidans]|uniref:Phosphatidylserine decarboxylase proenzyme n=1 Tax=Desulfobacca acetoxidans (strain ATCC 700848 / DSM 11109 / ASRB2) TaxID=880072 RepID=F2NIE4_DESAR|nr:phosphatidylserine decarboxylase family protein [Desulfobacca acetoxidans]AEB10346.1 Phosphatidylserine decarboxylase proenzyme [Desulfobacca acetoxidans DSM 11109]